MPAYEAEDYIVAAVESVIRQTYPSWELIVVDDNSKDKTHSILCQLASGEPRITVLKNENNLGTAGARNHALDAAKGELLAFLDSDDMWDPCFLEKQVAFLERQNCFGVTSGYRRLHKNNTTDFIPPNQVEAKSLLKGNAISCLSTVFRKPQSPLYFDKDLKKCEDLYYWYQVLSQNGPFYGNMEVLATYRIHDKSKSRDKVKLIKWQWAVYKKCRLPFFERLKCLILWAFYGLRKYKGVRTSKTKSDERK